MSSNLNIIKAVSGDVKDINVDISLSACRYVNWSLTCRRSMQEGNACLTPTHTGFAPGGSCLTTHAVNLPRGGNAT
eukprot:2093774-Amphidinium_carterae.1